MPNNKVKGEGQGPSPKIDPKTRDKRPRDPFTAPSLAPRRSARLTAAPCRPPESTEEIIKIYKVDPQIPRRDQAELQQTIDEFHAQPGIQKILKTLKANTEQYLILNRSPESGYGYYAKLGVPKGTPLLAYVGALKPAQAVLGNHDMALGKINAGYDLVVCGSLDTGGLQLVNHACGDRANCEIPDDGLYCPQTGLSVLFVQTKRAIVSGEQILFSYQKEVTRTSFWQREQDLPRVPRG